MGLDRGQSQEPADEDENLPQCDLQQNNQAAVVLETYVVVWPLDLSFPGILFRNFQPKNGIDKCLLQVMYTIDICEPRCFSKTWPSCNIASWSVSFYRENRVAPWILTEQRVAALLLTLSPMHLFICAPLTSCSIYFNFGAEFASLSAIRELCSMRTGLFRVNLNKSGFKTWFIYLFVQIRSDPCLLFISLSNCHPHFHAIVHQNESQSHKILACFGRWHHSSVKPLPCLSPPPPPSQRTKTLCQMYLCFEQQQSRSRKCIMILLFQTPKP